MQETKRIVCIGDSNTYGYDPRDFFGEPYERPWPQRLAEMTSFEVVNLGENGMTLPKYENTFKWIKQDLLKNEPIDLLIVMLGSNDVSCMQAGGTERVVRRMDDFIVFLKDLLPDTKILLMGLPPMTLEESIRDYDRMLVTEEYMQLAKEHGLFFADPAGWSLKMAFDGLHLSEEDHEIFARKTAEEVRRAGL